MELDYYLFKYKVDRAEFAKASHMSTSHLSTLVNKKRNPSLPTAARIWRASEGRVSFLEQLMMKDRLKDDKGRKNN